MLILHTCQTWVSRAVQTYCCATFKLCHFCVGYEFITEQVQRGGGGQGVEQADINSVFFILSLLFSDTAQSTPIKMLLKSRKERDYNSCLVMHGDLSSDEECTATGRTLRQQYNSSEYFLLAQLSLFCTSYHFVAIYGPTCLNNHSVGTTGMR